MDPYRLPRFARPTRYDLRLEPDLATLSFTGEETVTLESTEPTAEIVMNAVELKIGEATITSERGDAQRGVATLDEAAERCRVVFPSPLAPGTWRLRLAFTGILNDKLRGFYRSSYKDSSGEMRLMAATQFEATDARRAFPCWDEPEFKAVFAGTLVIDPKLTAVSNTAIKGERVAGGRQSVTFADSMKL